MALPFDTTKLPSGASTALTTLLNRMDLTPETLAKTFKDLNESPEKLRALLNLWFVPRFKPTFTPDRDYAVAGLRDVEFLATPDLPPGQMPYRMFDIETGNLVEFPAIGVRGQYCMLSHRWKGAEVTLGDVRAARRKELERVREMGRIGGEVHVGEGRKSDVELVLGQCKLDIEEQEGLIAELCPVGGGDVGELLHRRLKVRAIEDRLGWAKNEENKARSKLRFAEMERKIFSQLVGQIKEQVDEKMREDIGGTAPAKVTAPIRQASYTDAGSEVVAEVKLEAEKAREALHAAQTDYTALAEDVSFFQQHVHLRDALDEMISRLQKWKSAIKIQRSIQHAKHIFKNKLFQHREKCYLWTDTCCIDKSNGGELLESLSLMGDWYSSAEYTLVQLDTKFAEADAIKDWFRFESERNAGHPGPSEPNIESFNKIHGSKPEWSTRAWTLQELVMSKTTFYVNSEWLPLSRPVESLGYFYYLIPFIALYTGGDTKNIYRSSAKAIQGFWKFKPLKEILKDHKVPRELKHVEKHIERSHSGEATRIEVAQQLIVLLDALGVRIPKDMSTETATSEMARSVYLASAELAAPDESNNAKRALLVRIRSHLPEPDISSLPKSLSPEEADEEMTQHAINFILQCLVAETEDLVLADRKYIASFGQIQQLGPWQQGTSRTGFSAESVLAISGKRWATVATDRAYALMGVLGVRFPTFSAEGYAKALARLLDEVVITRNDVSVFNWTGMEMRSPIRGRSMYPASHTAYGNQEDRVRRYNLLLSAQVQDKMHDVMATYHGVVHTLRSAIDFIKDRERKNLPLGWIERIVQLVQQTGFRELKPRQEGFGKIVGYIREHCGRQLVAPSPVKEDPAESAPATGAKGFSFPKRPTIPSMPSLPSPSFSLPSLKSSTAPKKEAEGAGAPANKGSKFSGLGKGMKAPSFGFGKKGADSAAKETAEIQSPTSPETIQDPPPPPYEESPSVPAKPSWEAHDPAVLDYLSNTSTTKTLPAELQAINFELSEPGRRAAHVFNKHSSSPNQPLDTISPNPIIVNNSGIEGLFDIQRVIVTMIDPDKLRRQIAKAASPHDKISGWCSISTGFARVITNFACERQILEQELDVIQAVEAKVLKEQDKEDGQKRGARLLKSLAVTNATTKSTTSSVTPEAKTTTPDQGNNNEPTPDPETANTEEESLITRLLTFIQEPSLSLIAGEWVLARFSGTPGANWFLCHLELGPSSNQFYGHRIATGAIDFSDSTPEPGLVNAWQTYMERKKRKMCYILGEYLRSRMMGMEGEERLKAGEEMARRGVDIAVKGVGTGGERWGLGGLGLGGGTSSGNGNGNGNGKGTSPGGEKGEGQEKERQSGDESDSGEEEDEEGSLLDKVLGQGKLAVRAFGEYTVLAVAEKLFEMHADHLDKKLATSVLKRTPKSLRTAVENMNDNKSFLPAMFHSSTRVHMF